MKVKVAMNTKICNDKKIEKGAWYLGVFVGRLHEGHAGQREVVLALFVADRATVVALEDTLTKADAFAARVARLARLHARARNERVRPLQVVVRVVTSQAETSLNIARY